MGSCSDYLEIYSLLLIVPGKIGIDFPRNDRRKKKPTMLILDNYYPTGG